MPTAILTRSHRGGTLIEVLAATTLLAGVLTASLVSVAKYRAAAADAKLRTRAVQLADRQLHIWRTSQSFSGQSVGVLAEPGWRWETQTRSIQIENIKDVQVVSVDILPPEKETPIISVEILTYTGSRKSVIPANEESVQ